MCPGSRNAARPAREGRSAAMRITHSLNRAAFAVLTSVNPAISKENRNAADANDRAATPPLTSVLASCGAVRATCALTIWKTDGDFEGLGVPGRTAAEGGGNGFRSRRRA